MLDIKHIRSFLALAKELHFGQAAERLHIVQPALSMHIKALEEELGTALFTRSSRKVSLTRAGEVFRTDAIAVLQRIDESIDRVRQARDGAIGELRLGASATALGSGAIAPFIRTYAERYPGVRIKVREIHPFDQAAALQEGEIDAAFAAQQIDESFSGKFISQKLAAYPYILAVSHNHPLARRKRIAFDAIAGETWICLENERDNEAVNFVFGTPSALPERCLFASSPLTMLSLVDAGLGVAVISSALRKNAGQGVTFIALDGLTQEMEVWVYTRRDEQEPVIRSFLTIIEQMRGPIS